MGAHCRLPLPRHQRDPGAAVDGDGQHRRRAYIFFAQALRAVGGDKFLSDLALVAMGRYRGGAASYLEFLTNETNAFNAELGLTQARLNELVTLVDIYRNLGGGWDQ